uniref:hypothetical protein n=1 Tax=Thaumasiovibrio subtropicus TaxID=1891207 RepID=UPI000B35D7E1|nr:hypothetical protein [Thaumasiovibrio subtropicus]
MLTGCLSLGGGATSNRFTNLEANGAIRWSDGSEDEMIISPSGSTLTFPGRASLLSPNGVSIYNRIDSARNGDCEHYYVEDELRRRLTICSNTEVTMMNEGKVEKVGRLRMYGDY